MRRSKVLETYLNRKPKQASRASAGLLNQSIPSLLERAESWKKETEGYSISRRMGAYRPEAQRQCGETALSVPDPRTHWQTGQQRGDY
jgi:hypothetical protein